jgi:putative ABC transport system permease protein
MVLLVGATLFVQSLANVRAAEMGFVPDHVLVVEASLRGEEIPGGSRAFYAEAEARVRALPSVERVSVVQSFPFGPGYQSPFFVPGVDSADQRGEFYLSAVEPDYFAAIGTRILRGRRFTGADVTGAPLVVIVSDGMARALWPGDSAIGKCIRLGDAKGPCSTVVGVTPDARRNGVRPEKTMQYYVAAAQRQPNTTVTALVVRVAGDSHLQAEPLRRVLQSRAPGAVFVRVRPLADLVEPSIQPWRLGADAFGALGILALVIAGLGMYSVVAYSASQRAHDMAVRIALGARARHVVAIVLGEGFRATSVGVAVGTAVAFVGGPQLGPLLFAVSPHDPVIFSGVAVVLLVVGAIAGAVPSWRVMRLDPVAALKKD